MKNRTRVFVLVLAMVFLVSAGSIYLFSRSQNEPAVLVVSDEVNEIIKFADEVNSENQQDSSEPSGTLDTAEVVDDQPADSTDRSEHVVPANILLPVPFIVQAPYGNWDLPYKEACEEASVMMVHEYYSGETEFTEAQMKTAIDQIIDWGTDTFHTYDTTAAQSARYFTEKLGYSDDRVKVLYDVTIDDMKALLARGIPIIVPAAGQDIGNKYFQTPGPLYHMLVIVGYDENEFITNDPGTKRGAGYRYDENVLYSAMHDLTENLEEIRSGRKAIIVVLPE